MRLDQTVQRLDRDRPGDAEPCQHALECRADRPDFTHGHVLGQEVDDRVVHRVGGEQVAPDPEHLVFMQQAERCRAIRTSSSSRIAPPVPFPASPGYDSA